MAVIGASRREHSIGREILHNLIQYEFRGAVYPVNPRAGVVHSIRAYRRLDAIPDEVDLAVIVVGSVRRRRGPSIPAPGSSERSPSE